MRNILKNSRITHAKAVSVALDDRQGQDELLIVKEKPEILSGEQTANINVQGLYEDDTAISSPNAFFTLTVLRGKEIGKLIRLDKERSYTIGRSEQCDIAIDERSVSRFHAVLKLTDDRRLFLFDCESRNGTFVRSSRLKADETILLVEGDKIQIGEGTLFRVNLHDQVDEAFHQKMYDAAVSDPMTAVYNKTYLLDHLERELARSKRHKTFLSLIMVDVDHFKKINDQYGHLVGDDVLKNVARSISLMLRKEDLIGRYGGEEFAIVTVNQSLDSVAKLAERIRRVLANATFKSGDRTVGITVSQGIACTSVKAYERVEDLIRDADEKLYLAKRGGRNRVESI